MWILIMLFLSTIHALEINLPYGHPNRCYDILKGRYADLPTLGEVPGEGFDNLVNIPMAAVIDTKYTMCKVTDDGHFLIPDSITVVPTKESHLKTTMAYFQHWDNFTSTTSSSINIQPGFGSFFKQISGKFSREFETIKTRMCFEKSRTLRMQNSIITELITLLTALKFVHLGFNYNYRFGTRGTEHIWYTAQVCIRKSYIVEEIANHILSNRTDLATYECQLLVRQHGTHVVTGIEIGASIVKNDQLSEKIDIKTESDRQQISLAAELSFFSWLNKAQNRTRNYSLIFNYNEASLQQASNEYMSLLTSTEMYTLGGSINSLGEDESATSWSRSVEQNLVSLDRIGDPLYYFINEDTMPNLPEPILQKLADLVKAAVFSYYEHNVIRGCTDFNSPRFSFEANVDDGSCKTESDKSPYLFGGVYQECYGNSGVCQGITYTNPLTGSYSCPEGFQRQLIHSGSKSSIESTTVSSSCWIFFTCHEIIQQRVIGYYTAYWCFASSGQNPLLFGGVFTPYFDNVLTQSQSCPPAFYSVKILDYLYVCISQDKELGFRNSLPFAGFYSCEAGNPFARNQHGCPDGFSQHLAYMDDGCEIDYCILTDAIRSFQLPNIQRPPFMELPFYNATEYIAVAQNGTIMKIEDFNFKKISLIEQKPEEVHVSMSSFNSAVLEVILGVSLTVYMICCRGT